MTAPLHKLRRQQPHMQVSPHDLANERAILAAALLDGARATDLASVVDAADFYGGAESAHGRLWVLLQRYAAAGEPLDTLRIVPLIQDRAEDYGGLAYVTGLPDRCALTVNVGHYVRTLQEHARRRRAIDAAYALADAAHDLHRPLSETVAEHSAAVVPLQSPPGDGPRLSLAEDIDAERWRREQGACHLQLPWRDLERRTRLERGHMLVAVGRPGMGKSAWALQLCDAFARRGYPSLYICLEMPRAALGLRLVARRGRIDLGALLDPAPLQGDAVDRYEDALKSIHADPIDIIAGSGWSLARCEATIRRAKLMQPELTCVAVDYVQLLSGPDRRADRQQQTAEISKRLKALALELEVLIVAVAQLNRSCEARANKRPTLSDIRESGQLEQDADTIVAFYRHAYYHEDADPQEAEALVLKARWGETGTSQLRWTGAFQRFADPDYVPPTTYRGSR